MATTRVNTHTGSNLDWTTYRYGDNTLVFTFQDSDGNPFDISGETFTLHIRKIDVRGSDVLTLTEGSGLTKGESQLTIYLSAEDISTDLKKGLYFLQMDWDNGTSNRALVQGKLRILDQENSGSTSSSATLSINTGDRVVEITVRGGEFQGGLNLVESTTELTFDADKEMQTIDGGTTTFTLAASGHRNGVCIVARINEPVAVNFPATFERDEDGDEISTTHMNDILMIYRENWDGQGNDKVLYSIKNWTAI